MRDAGGIATASLDVPARPLELVVPHRPASAATADRPLLRTPVVGRDDELEELQDGLADAVAGRGELFLLSGEPGIGKTTVAELLASSAAGRGFAALWASCWESVATPDFWPWIQCLRECAREAGIDVPAELEAGMLAQGAPRCRIFELIDAVSSFFCEAAAARPLLIVLDDLHWADRPSLELLCFLGRQIRRSRIAIVGTFREAELSAREDAVEVVSTLSSVGRRLPLRSLGREEVARLVELWRGNKTSSGALDAIWQTTEGNPFYVRELVRLNAFERPAGERGRLPATIRATVRRRLARLPKSCTELLATASVLGREFDLECLARLTARSAAELADLLRPALASGIVQIGEEAEAFRFAHGLIRETLRVAADPGSDLAKVVDYCERAGIQAAENLAHRAATLHFERALHAFEEIGRPDQHRYARLLRLLGRNRRFAGDDLGGIAALERAIAIARTIGDGHVLALSAIDFAAFDVRVGDTEPDRVRALEVALDALGDSDPALRARLLARLAFHRYVGGADPLATEGMTREALAIARRVADLEALCEVLSVAPLCLSGPDSLSEQKALVEQFFGIVQATGRRDFEFQGRLLRLWARGEEGDAAGYRRELAVIRSVAESFGGASQREMVESLEAFGAYLEGRFEEAERIGEASENRLQRSHHSFGGVWPLLLCDLRFQQGRLAEIEPLLPLLGESAWGRVRRCAFYALTGRREQAATELAAFGADFSGIRIDSCRLASLVDLADVAIALRDRARIETLSEILRPHADRMVSAGAFVYRGAASRSLAVLAEALGRAEEARRYFEQALARNERARVPQVTAVTCHDFGAFLLRAGETVRAAELLRRAAALASDLGMTLLQANVATELCALEEPTRPTLVPEHTAQPAAMRLEGEFWTIEFGFDVVRLKDSKGLRDIAALLARRLRDIHVMELVSADAPLVPVRAVGRREAMDLGLRMSGPGPDGPPLDTRARAEYRARLLELRAEIEAAEHANDPGRAERAREELQVVAAELGRGLERRAADPADPVEKARKTVGSRIRNAISRLRAAHPELARHFARSLRTGTFCCYAPEAPIDWSITWEASPRSPRRSARRR